MSEHEQVNILMVDDQPSKLLSYEVILGELGENLIKAGSGREALEHLLKTDIAVVLMDVSMPEIDGFELAELIRQHPRYQETAIIFISAIHLTDVDQVKGYARGAVDYIPVPVIPELLRAKVRVFAELYRKTRQLARLNAELERRVAERTADLQRVNEDLRQVAYISAHDLQEPVRQVGVYTQKLAKRYGDTRDAETVEAMDFIIEGAQRMAAQFNDLMRYLEVDERGQEKAATDCEEVLQRALEPLRGPVSASGATVTHDPLPTVEANAHQLQIIFHELLDNALKFCNSAPPRVHVWATRQERGWRFAIRDNGIGIDPQYYGRLFGFFRRLDRQRYEGTGMGLAICKKIVERHGGRIWIEPTPGGGTTLLFTIGDGDSSQHSVVSIQ
jgi:two-component system, sensor histidine kinase and response regulator